MKKTILFLATILTASLSFGQNIFPPDGNVGIGTLSPTALLTVAGNVVLSSAANRKIEISGTLTGATSPIGILNQSIIQSDVTTAYYNRTLANTQATAFTLSNIRHYQATQGTFGVGSIVTSQSAFFADATLTGATLNYGFSGYLPLNGTANWNAYMGGTAPNYFNGDVLVGTTTNSLSTKLFVNGNGTLRPPTGGGTALNLLQTTVGSNASPTSNKISWVRTDLLECGSIDVPDSRTNVNGVPMIFTTRDNSNVVSEKMRIANGGNVLIGTSVDPGIKLCIENNTGATTSIASFKNTNVSAATLINCSDSNGSAVASLGVNSSASTANASFGGIGESFVRSNANSSGLVLSTANSVGNIRFLTTGSGTERMRIESSGNVGIGTTIPDSKLTVNGTIHATEVKVTATVPADYVFEKYYLGESSLKPDYTLLTLSEVEKYTTANHHLPNVPSAKEIKENGLHLGEMSNILLQKIEELTLYSIEQKKTIEKQATAIEKLEKENQAFKSIADRLSKIERELEDKK